MWYLVLTLVTPSGVAIQAVPRQFADEKLCVAAGEKWKTAQQEVYTKMAEKFINLLKENGYALS